MRKRKTIYGLLFLLQISMFVSTSIVFGAEVMDSFMCTNVDESGVATGKSTEFFTSTPEVYVRAVFSGILPGQVITFGWDIPGGANLAVSDPIIATSETTYGDSIPIVFTTSVNYANINDPWTVNIYVDNELLDSLNFILADIVGIRENNQILTDDYFAAIELVQEANDQVLLWQTEMEDLIEQTTEIEANYSSVLAQNLVIQNDLEDKVTEFSLMELQYNNLNTNYTINIQELVDVQDELESLKNNSGDNTTLYLAIGAAVVAILAAAYFYTKSR